MREPRYNIDSPYFIQAIIIKRLISVIFLLMIVAMAFIITGFYISFTLSHDAKSISDGQKARAIAIALGDDYVGYHLGAAKNYSIGEIAKPSPGNYDYSGETDRLVVPFQVESGSVENILFVTVDLDENRTVSVYNDRPGILSEKRKMDSIKIALNDSGVVSAINDNIARSSPGSHSYGQAAYIIDNVTMAGNDTGYSYPDGNSYGYLNDTSAYVDVSLLMWADFPGYFLDVIADTSNGTILADRFKGDGPEADTFTVTIRPGNGFYRSFGAGYDTYGNTIIANYSLMMDNASRSTIAYPAMVCIVNDTDAPGIKAIFVDADNFTKLRNGIAYETMNDRIITNDKGWTITVPMGTDFYMVLSNNASKDATVSMVI